MDCSIRPSGLYDLIIDLESLVIAVIQIVFFIFVMHIIRVELTVFAAAIASIGSGNTQQLA